jgi:glycosyltransferase involved in cell wall biosynthesis
VRLLHCVVSFNRFPYLKNTVESLHEFLQFGDLLVVDDGSDDPATQDYLGTLEADKNTAVIRQEPWRHDTYEIYGHNDFFENLDIGVAYAIDGNYDYINFVQDDVQFMWHDDSIPEQVERTFSTLADAAQVILSFFPGIYACADFPQLALVKQCECYHYRPHGMISMGIVPVKLLKDKDYRFGNGDEATNSGWWRRSGYRAYMLRNPVMARVPWPQVWWRGQQVSEGHAPSARYYLKPLEPSDVDSLRSRPLSEIPYQEHYCHPWEWHCKRPYWYTRKSDKYQELRGCALRALR